MQSGRSISFLFGCALARGVRGRGTQHRFVQGAVAALALLLALGWSCPALAGGFHISILGVRRTGMMTNLADPDDVTALFHNPAGLADLPGRRLHLSSGITLLSNTTYLQELDPDRFPSVTPLECGQPGNDPCPYPVGADGYYEQSFEPESYIGIIPYVGISEDLSRFDPKLSQVVVSMAAYAPGAYGANLSEEAPTSFYVIKGLFVVAAATAGVGWRVNDWLAIGANLSYNYLRLGFAQKFSTTDVVTPADEEPGFEAEMAQAVLGDLRLDYTGTDHGMGWGAGVLVTPLDWVSLGVSYSGFTSASLRGDVVLRSTGTPVINPLTPTELRERVAGMGYKLPYELIVEMPIPPALMAGLNVTPWPWLEIGFDYRLWFYSLYGRQKMIPIYDPDEEGEEPMSEESLSKDKDYSNSYEVALGFLVRPLGGDSDLEIMAGVAYDRTPVPDKSFSIDNPSMSQLIFSAGVRTTQWQRWRLGLGYMLINYMARDITTSQTSPPTNVRIDGRAHIPTLEAEVAF